MSSVRPLSGTLPWTKSCFVCGALNPHGLHLRSRVEGERVLLDYTTREADLGYRQIVHGGITITLLDEVMTWAAILCARRMCVAAEVSTRLLAAITVGHTIRAEGRVTRPSPRLIVTEGLVTDCASGAVLAKAVGKYAAMPEDQVPLCADDFVTSPEALSLKEIFEP